MPHKIKQINGNNTIGFAHKENSDIGLDEDGNVAPGYQHHDALWWSGPSRVEAQRPKTLELDSTVAYFNNLFFVIAYKLVGYYNPSTVLDLGSGSGLLCNRIRQFNSSITTATVDANQLVQEKSPYIDENHFTAQTDKKLDFKFVDGEKAIFDLVVSLEHFEHVPADTFDTLMGNIVAHTRKGSALVFTAASWKYEEEDQEHVHCHIKSRDEWIRYVESYGFEVNRAPFALNRAGDTIEIFATRTK